MTDWSKHVHRFAKKHNMSYKQANVSRKCKETYKKRKTSPRRKSPRRKTSPRRKRRMNNPLESYKTQPGRLAYERKDPEILLVQIDQGKKFNDNYEAKLKKTEEEDGDTESGQARMERIKTTLKKYEKFRTELDQDLATYVSDVGL